MPKNVNQALAQILAKQTTIQSHELAEAAGITRQGAHKRLRALVAAGELVAEGAGRASRYRRPSGRVRRAYAAAGLAEDRVWRDMEDAAPELRALPANVSSILFYAFTEIVNNAVDHSGSKNVEVAVEPRPDRIVFEVVDRGVGIFEHVRRSLALGDRMAALQELSKGKLTTMPERHTGEGIFFSSKIADTFEIESGGLHWIVDNVRGDTTVAPVAERPGTSVRFEIGRSTPKKLEDLFAEYTEDFEFTKSRTVVKLFVLGARFVSRSEAKRLVHGLERFREVVLDFQGVEAVGQGFVDEVFRVWARLHPTTRLTPVNMTSTVEFMVRRGLPRP